MPEDWVFILSLVLLITFITQVGALAGQTLVKNAPPAPKFPEAPSAPSNPAEFFGWMVGVIAYSISNLTYFFSLMSVSSEYLFLGLIVIALTVTLLWILIKLIITALPKFVPFLGG